MKLARCGIFGGDRIAYLGLRQFLLPFNERHPSFVADSILRQKLVKYARNPPEALLQ
jgi:hypothetical protein